MNENEIKELGKEVNKKRFFDLFKLRKEKKEIDLKKYSNYEIKNIDKIINNN